MRHSATGGVRTGKTNTSSSGPPRHGPRAQRDMGRDSGNAGVSPHPGTTCPNRHAQDFLLVIRLVLLLFKLLKLLNAVLELFDRILKIFGPCLVFIGLDLKGLRRLKALLGSCDQ